jgi:septal ring factor EnvC (AmiA/AmiB activator)
MDTTNDTLEQNGSPLYKTSKQVQAWFLRRSRDTWKKKYADLKVEARRFKQHVADADRSRAKWREDAEKAIHQLAELQAETTRLRTELDAANEALKKKGGLPSCSR